MRSSIDLRKLQSIDLYAFKEFCSTLDSPYPTNLVDAQFNARFLIAVALMHDDVNAGLRAPDFHNEALRKLFYKINIHHDAECDAMRRVDMSIPTRVVVKVDNEPSQELLISEPQGSERRGIADMAQTQSKFRSALSPFMPDSQIGNIISLVASLERCAVVDLMAVFSEKA